MPPAYVLGYTMLRRSIYSVSLGYFFALLIPISAWQQMISTDGSSELRLKGSDYKGDECHNRNGKPEGVMGLMNTRNSEQLKAMAFWTVGNCDRGPGEPERFSLFIHWYDIPAGIQLLDLGLPGLEHGWKSFKNIIPDSPSWVNLKHPRGGKFVPGPDGLTPVGAFFAELLKRVPPGSIRYRIRGTNEYITVKDAIYVPKFQYTGAPLIEDKVLTREEMEEARATFRGQVGSWYYATGGAPMHMVEPKEYIFAQRLKQAESRAADPRNLGKMKDPGAQVAREMLREYRYPEGDEKSKAQVNAANEKQEEAAQLYAQYLQQVQIQQLLLNANSMSNQAPGGQAQSQSIAYPPQSYSQIIEVNQPSSNNMMSGYPLLDYPHSQTQLQEYNQEEPGQNFKPNEITKQEFEQEMKFLEDDFQFIAPSSMVDEEAESYEDMLSRKSSHISLDSFIRNFVSPSQLSSKSYIVSPQQQLISSGAAQTYNDVDRDLVDVLDEQYLREREALRSKSLNELDLEFGYAEDLEKFGELDFGNQALDMGTETQIQMKSANQEPVVDKIPSLDKVEEEISFIPDFEAFNEERTQASNPF